MDVRAALNELLASRGFQELEERLRDRSIFDILRIETRETSHAALLAWLLNPRESHGLGKGPLTRFMLAVATRAEPGVMLDPADIAALDLDKVKVRPELVIDEKRRPDIVVHLPDDPWAPLLIVEYKVDAAEGTDQTKDYAAWADKHRPRLGTRTPLPLLVFLCPDGDDKKPPTAPFVHFNYEDYLQWLRPLRPENEQARFLLKQFVKCLRQRADAHELDKVVAGLEKSCASAIDTLEQATGEDRELIRSVMRNHEAALELLEIPVGRRDLGESQFVAAGRKVAEQTLTTGKWKISGGEGSVKARLRESDQAYQDLRAKGLLGPGPPLRIETFLTRPNNGAARLALAIRGATNVPGLTKDESSGLRDKLADDLRKQLESGPLGDSLGTWGTIAVIKVKPSGDEDTEPTAKAALPALNQAFGRLRDVEVKLETWCRNALPDLLTKAKAHVS